MSTANADPIRKHVRMNRVYTLLLAICMSIVVACSEATDRDAASNAEEKADSPEEVTRAFLEAGNAGDLDTCRSLLTEQAWLGFEAEFDPEGEAFPDYSVDVADIEGNIAKVPVDEATAGDKAFNAIFKKKRKKASDKVTGRQAEIEQEWDAMVKANYEKARDLAEQALGML